MSLLSNNSADLGLFRFLYPDVIQQSNLYDDVSITEWLNSNLLVFMNLSNIHNIPREFDPLSFLISLGASANVSTLSRSIKETILTEGFTSNDVRKRSQIVDMFVKDIVYLGDSNFSLDFDTNSNYQLSDGLIQIGDYISIQKKTNHRLYYCTVESINYESNLFTISLPKQTYFGLPGTQFLWRGIDLCDPDRIAVINFFRLAAFSNTIDPSVLYFSDVHFNSELYRLFYPDSKHLSDIELYSEYIAYLSNQEPRIGKVYDLRNPAFYIDTIDNLSVNYQLRLIDKNASIAFKNVTIYDVSTDSFTNSTHLYPGSTYPKLITEYAIKKYVDVTFDRYSNITLSNLTIRQSLCNEGISTFMSNVDLYGTVNIQGSNDLIINTRLLNYGQGLFYSNVTFYDSIYTADVDVQSNLNIYGQLTCLSNAVFEGDIQANQTINVSSVKINDSLHVQSESVFDSNVSLLSSLYISCNIECSSNLVVQGSSLLHDAFISQLVANNISSLNISLLSNNSTLVVHGTSILSNVVIINGYASNIDTDHLTFDLIDGTNITTSNISVWTYAHLHNLSASNISLCNMNSVIYNEGFTILSNLNVDVSDMDKGYIRLLDTSNISSSNIFSLQGNFSNILIDSNVICSNLIASNISLCNLSCILYNQGQSILSNLSVTIFDMDEGYVRKLNTSDFTTSNIVSFSGIINNLSVENHASLSNLSASNIFLDSSNSQLIVSGNTDLEKLIVNQYELNHGVIISGHACNLTFDQASVSNLKVLLGDCDDIIALKMTSHSIYTSNITIPYDGILSNYGHTFLCNLEVDECHANIIVAKNDVISSVVHASNLVISSNATINHIDVKDLYASNCILSNIMADSVLILSNLTAKSNIICDETCILNLVEASNISSITVHGNSITTNMCFVNETMSSTRYRIGGSNLSEHSLQVDNNEQVSLTNLEIKEYLQVGSSNTIGSNVVQIYGNIAADNIASTSDRRIKHNISPLKNSKDMLNALRPVSYNVLNSSSMHLGFIADEVEKVLPDAVYSYNDRVIPCNIIGRIQNVTDSLEDIYDIVIEHPSDVEFAINDYLIDSGGTSHKIVGITGNILQFENPIITYGDKVEKIKFVKYLIKAVKLINYNHLIALIVSCIQDQ